MSHDFEYVSKQTRALCRELERHGWNVVRDDAGKYLLLPDNEQGMPDWRAAPGTHETFRTIADAARMGLALIEQGNLEEGFAS